MINPAELRKGNKVNWLFETTTGWVTFEKTVKCLHTNTIEAMEGHTFEYSRLEGIELTDEWLRRFGLVERYVKGEWSWSKCTPGKTWPSYTEISREEDGYYYWLLDYPPIKYVHQLQNLYFILTGEELIYNEPEKTEENETK